jgi:glycosyltransferase involved in cell wall biosynthesis
MGRVFPKLMDFYWQIRKDEIKYINERTSFLMEALNQADTLICRSKFIQSMYEAAGVNPSRLIFSRQGLPKTLMAQENFSKSPSSILRVGYLGQISKVKGVHVLLEAFRLLKDLPLHLGVYGNMDAHPKYSSELKKFARSDPRIEFLGTYSDLRELKGIYQSLDVVVVPSIWYENSPTVILEAFAHRTPVITSNLGGMAELVEDEKNGLLFSPGSAIDLAAKIRKICENPDFLSHLNNNIATVKTHGEEMNELISIYQRLYKTGK